MDYNLRLKRLQATVAASGFDALLIKHLPNIQYLCGFAGSAGALLISSSKSLFFTDGRYKEQARAEVQGARVVISPRSPLGAVADRLAKTKPGRKRIGIEGEYFTVADRTRLTKALSSGVHLREAPSWVEQARMVKDDEEIGRLRNAALLGSNLFQHLLKLIRPDSIENTVAAELEFRARRLGADGMSFETIVAAGKRSALPHGRASGAPIPRQGFVVCDFGVILANYCSDMTRTVHVGRPTGEARSAYQAVQAAQQAAVDAVRPGARVGEVDQAARKLLQQSRLSRYFTHSTGHGVGLEIHEAPRIAAKQTEVLRPGMVITIEPGIYIPGKWGIRIEDMVLVTDRGCEVLTPVSKELITIGD